MYPLKHSRFWLAAAYALMLLIVGLSLLPGLPSTKTTGFDKLGHMLMYALLAVWFCGIYRPQRWLPVGVALAALGGMLEIAQSWTVTRTPEWPDMGANLVGIFFGLLLGWKLLAGWCVLVERRLGLRAGLDDMDSP